MLVDIFPLSFDCSNSLDKFFYQLPNLLAKNSPSPCSPLIDECQIKGLQRLLFYERQDSAQLRSFVEMLCQELESLVSGLGKNLMFLETEVQFTVFISFFGGGHILLKKARYWNYHFGFIFGFAWSFS